jgi:hypothetical protein
MNVFNTGAAGYGIAGAGGYVFGSGWGVPDLVAVTNAGPVVTLAPNQIGDPDPFWYTPFGSPGATGNKIMDANMYHEVTGPLAGQLVTFSGLVLANTLANGPVDAAGHGWTSVAFIKDFDAGFALINTTTIALTPGVFSISLTANADPAHHIQWGFETIGPDVWAGDPLTFDNVQVTAVPEPSSIGLALTGLLGLVAFAWKRRV